jgi:hypothetical protein
MVVVAAVAWLFLSKWWCVAAASSSTTYFSNATIACANSAEGEEHMYFVHRHDQSMSVLQWQ